MHDTNELVTVVLACKGLNVVILPTNYWDDSVGVSEGLRYLIRVFGTSNI